MHGVWWVLCARTHPPPAPDVRWKCALPEKMSAKGSCPLALGAAADRRLAQASLAYLQPAVPVQN